MGRLTKYIAAGALALGIVAGSSWSFVGHSAPRQDAHMEVWSNGMYYSYWSVSYR